MARARSSQLWDHTAEILALLHNINCAEGKEADTEDYHLLEIKRSAALRELNSEKIRAEIRQRRKQRQGHE